MILWDLNDCMMNAKMDEVGKMDYRFVELLKTVPLSRREYGLLDLAPEYIEWRIGSFAVKRKRAELCMDLGDALLNLVCNYDLSDLVIGGLRFDDCVGWEDDFFEVGRFDDGHLCVSRFDGSVQVLTDLYMPESWSNKAYYCGCASDAFLEALIPAAVFIERRLCEGDALSGELTEGMIQYCSELAGKNSAAFFRALLQGPEC